MFTITHKDSKSNARTGQLTTAHGILETPFFMPIATKGTVKHLTPHELKTLGTNVLISNAFLLYLRPGLPIIKKFKGLHNFMHWDGSIFTDSGGFQILSPKFLLGINDKGVSFNNPYTKKNEFFTPEKVMEIESTIGSDVAMTLDHVPHSNQDYKTVADAVKRTHLWAARCIKAHDNPKQLLFGITQGAIYKDLREQSAKAIAKMDFDGVALGGFCIGEDKKIMLQLVEHSLTFIPSTKPRYLMGVGSPEDILTSISMGVDAFDSRYPTQNARHGSVFTTHGEIDITKQTYQKDAEPIDPACTCPTCQHVTRAFLHHLFRTREPMAERYATTHNIHFLQHFMVIVRQHIREGTFTTFKKEFLRTYL